MKERLTKNWGLKLIALVSAVLIWLLIMNTNDPVTTFTVSDIPIEFLHEESIIENEMVYEVIGSKTVSVSVTTRTRDKDKIKAEDFKATVDLNDIYGITSRVEIKVELISDQDVVWDWQQIDFGVHIATENVVTKDFVIEVVQTGEIGDGYNHWQCTLSRETVALRAPESQLLKIGAVKAIVDVSKSAASGNITVPLTFYDTEGRVIGSLRNYDITADITTVSVNTVVQKTSPVSLDVLVSNKDQVAEGYRYITYRISHQSISVIGTMQSVAGLDKIQIEMDAAGADGNVTKQIDIMDYLPENVTVAGDTLITITLVVEQEGDIDIRVPVKNIILEGQSELLQYFILENKVTVNVFGLKSDWEYLTNADIELTLDLTGLEEGEYVLKPTVAELEGLTLTVVSDLHVTIDSIPQESEEETGESDGETDGETGGETDGETGSETDDSTEAGDSTETDDSASAGGTEDVSGTEGTEESSH